MAAFSSPSWQILVPMMLAAALAGATAPLSATTSKPSAAPPPVSPEALSEWSRDLTEAAEGLQQNCAQVASDLRNFGKEENNVGGIQAAELGLHEDDPAMLVLSELKGGRGRHTVQTAKVATLGELLDGLRDLESPARRVLGAIRTVEGTVTHGTCTEQNATEKSFATLPGLRGRVLVCLLGAVGKARALMKTEDKKTDLAAVEALAIQEAETDNSPDVQFGLGLYWSDVALASSEAAGSSDAWWVKDSGGASAPSPIVRAETLLQDSQVATESFLERENRAATRAHRIYQHAEFMAHKQHIAAASWRYLLAASLAASSNSSRVPMPGLEMHALTRLAYFLERGGKDAEALDAVNKALDVQHTGTSRVPLAKYLQSTLRRRLGSLRSAADVFEAEMHVLDAKGKLPSKALESERAAAHADFEAWRNVAEAPAWTLERFKKCLGMTDAARTMLCLLLSVVFS